MLLQKILNYLGGNAYTLFIFFNWMCLQCLFMKMFGREFLYMTPLEKAYYIVRYSKLKALYYCLFVSITGVPLFLISYLVICYDLKGIHYKGFLLFYCLFLIGCYFAYSPLQSFILNHPELKTLTRKYSDERVTYFQVWILRIIIFIFFFSIIYYPAVFYGMYR